MIPAPTLSESLLRLAHWHDAVRNGTAEMSPEGQVSFGMFLHAAADQAERLEQELRDTRQAALDAAVRRVLSEEITAGRGPDLTSAQLTQLVTISRGEVPNVVLFPKSPRRAVPWRDDYAGGGDAA